MSSKEEPSKCCPAAAPISSFTIQSILGSGSADPPREAGDRAPAWPARARTLSLSSEDEEPEESWKHRGCFCPEAQGPAEACHKHQPLSFTCLGEYPEGWDGMGWSGRAPPGMAPEGSAPVRPPPGTGRRGHVAPSLLSGHKVFAPSVGQAGRKELQEKWGGFFFFSPTPSSVDFPEGCGAMDNARFLRF